jgi:two-component system, chemotaxis family, chemotaxis protein CheY
MKFLVLDDHEAFREEIVAILVRNGHEAQGVATATAAIPMVEAGRYDFVLVDFNMPEHDGIWFMQNVKLPRGTKAILVTAHVHRQMINTMFKAGAVGYLIKPFDEDALLRQIEFHSKQGRYAPRQDSGSESTVT